MDINKLKELPPWEWPEDTGATLLPLLQNAAADPDDRLLAASMAGDLSVVDDALAGALLAIVEETGADATLRARAAIALGPALENADLMGFDEEEDVMISEGLFGAIQGVLKKCYRDAGCPKEVRRRCLEASVRAPQEWHAAAIRSAYISGDPDWRLTAVFGMNYIEGFEKQIMESLEDDDPDIFYEAISAAGSWEVDAAWPRIVALVGDADTEKELRLAAIESAVNIRPDDVGEILEPLLDEEDEDIVDAVHEALAMAEAMLEFDAEDDDEA
ncbi:MAG: HEAT repeat domain-containing protein [Pseudomonadota bacterium]